MKLYSNNNSYKLYHGNMLDMLEVIEPNTIDSIVCDPPYELNFMGKGWDNSGIAFNKETWQKCYEVLKPGGYLLAFGGSRTFHRIACAIEDAGFEIRDTIMWIYGSGFPKSMNIGLAIDKKNGVESEVIGQQVVPDITGDAYGTMNDKQGGSYKNIVRDIKKATNEWSGWGTALKPSFEPIIVARKPVEGTVVNNVLKWGVGGINIDECRVETNDNIKPAISGGSVGLGEMIKGHEYTPNDLGRFPANTILTYDETDFDEVCGGFPNTKGDNRKSKPTYDKSIWGNAKSVDSNCLYADSGSASRYFYCAKASKKDRDEGLDMFESKFTASAEFRPNHMEKALQGEDGNPYGRWKPVKNIHPTVKPTELMQYLVRLVTPDGGTVLDPFNGSGSTGKAVMYENKEKNKNYKYIGIELTEEYLPISKARIEYVCNLDKLDLENLLKIEEKETKQQSDKEECKSQGIETMTPEELAKMRALENLKENKE